MFNDGDNPYLAKTPTAGDRKKWTFSCWFKLGSAFTSTHSLLVSGNVSADQSTIRLDGGVIDWVEWDQSGNTTNGRLTTNRKFRDPGAWYHLVCTWDSDNGTSGDRMKMYINGVRETSFSTGTYPSSSYDSAMSSNVLHEIGRQSWNSSGYFDGYLAEMAFCDGQAYAASDFGEFDSDSPTVWKPKPISGLTFGTRGWHLDFADSSALGNDISGGNNDWTSNNLAAIDQKTDNPLNNFAVLNPLDYHRKSSTATPALLSEGNLKFNTSSSNSITAYVRSTFGVTKGKWYWETKIPGPVAINLGICYEKYFQDATHIAPWDNSSYHTVTFSRRGDNSNFNWSGRSGDSSTDTGVNADANDIVGWALDMDNSALYIHENGTYFNGVGSTAGVPTSGSSKTGDMLGLLHASNGVNYVNNGNEVFVTVGDSETGNSANIEVNFGNPPFTISSTNADANGYGSFEYAVPSGYFALCSKNLAEYA